MKNLKEAFLLHKKEMITAAMFLIVVFVMLFGLIASWKDVGRTFLAGYRSTVPPQSPVVERVVGAIASLENAVNEDTFQRHNFIELFGLTQKTMGKNIVSDSGYGALYKTSKAQITYAVMKKDVSNELEQIRTLKSQLDEIGIPLLYIQAPFKLPEKGNQLPPTVKDYANENADDFLAGLAASDIDYLDLRQVFWSSDLDQNQLFFNTDHHWTIDGAFLSMGTIVDKLNNDYQFHIDDRITNIENYNRTTYEDFYIGSMGRRVGKLYGGVDDFTLITPDFDTSYTLYERDYGGEKVYEGSFEEAVLTKDYIDQEAPLDTNRYAVYHGDNAELEFINHNVNSGKIMMIKDSFGLPVYSFLSLGVQELRALDVRLYKESVFEYAKKYRPEVVIILYNADCFGSTMFDFEAKN
ncbi:alginate O-acetyltransferase AlgX-related protein [Sinanaerobacter chloroacetimidivorans]|uniref:AlgX/AlgJ SGNH hydrolase-like domain-containing protein n=1 Tax=Sinanaerobacter chloroacetimidivorans TaxID=2818044 RepID=A0A8J7W051_9FIRM|nr:hypothetical protein [Sinanaerobacter chloroacetimidivorans]MBR0596746.1 hypothetical protein [Sinanaerobacter chloroacetimidivorans]